MGAGYTCEPKSEESRARLRRARARLAAGPGEAAEYLGEIWSGKKDADGTWQQSWTGEYFVVLHWLVETKPIVGTVRTEVPEGSVLNELQLEPSVTSLYWASVREGIEGVRWTDHATEARRSVSASNGRPRAFLGNNAWVLEVVAGRGRLIPVTVTQTAEHAHPEPRLRYVVLPGGFAVW